MITCLTSALYNMFRSVRMKIMFLFNVCTSLVSAELICRPEGAVVPRPVSLSSSPAFLSATRNVSDNFNRALNGTIQAGFPTENVSFSVAVVSLAQGDPATPLWDYHHLSAANINGTKELDQDSQYLIGSVSKLLTDAIVLGSGLSFDDSITKYLPELVSSDSPVRWKNISLGALASQLSGIPPNYGFSEFYFLKDYFETLGFPALNSSDYGPCGIVELNPACTRQQFLDGMLQVRPVSPPMTRPVYSNTAFSLLAFAVEAATGMDYTEQLRYYVTGPLGMLSTTVSPGFDDRAVIPPVQSSWGSDYGDSAPGGGLVSTISDLSTFFHAILSRNTSFLSPTTINSWLKPRSAAGSSRASVSSPWEIFTPDARTLTPAHPHTVPVYAKNGAAYGYNAQVGVVDDYGIAVVVLTAGEARAYGPIYDATLSAVVAAVDEAARDEAAQRGYVGTFGGPCEDGAEAGDRACFHVTVEQDVDSLKLSGVKRNGSDVLSAVRQIWSVTMGQFLPGPGLDGDYRILPTDISEGATTDDGTRVIREDWRIWWSTKPAANITRSDIPGVGFSAEQGCLGWTTADWLYYGNEALDRLVFVKEADSGVVVGLEIPYLRTTMLGRVSRE